MKHKLQKGIFSLLCIIALTVCSVPVSAANNDHVCIAVEVGRDEQPMSSSHTDSEYHTNKFHVYYKCQICKASMKDGYVYEKERHVWNGYYEDLGHGYDNHRYTVHCFRCSATIVVNIGCDYEINGVHRTPY